MALSSSIFAHFNAKTALRQFVIAETKTSTEIFIRTPLTLLFGDVTAAESAQKSPFVINRGTAENPAYFLSTRAIDAARGTFTQHLSQRFVWQVKQQTLTGRIRAYRIIPEHPEIGLTSVATGRESLARPSAQGDINMKQGHIDLLLTLPMVAKQSRLTLRSGLAPVTLAAGFTVSNQFTDVRNHKRLSYTRPGQLQQAVALPRSMLGITLEYIYQGVLHILEGIDHVFLVIVLTLGASAVPALIRTITAFSVGHMITLGLGILGYVPQGAWFIPLVEMAIAATIVMAAIAGYRRKPASALAYISIGLLHGFGFSFVLGNILGHDSPDLLPALAAFTVGIELGQLLIVAVILLLVALVGRTTSPAVTHKLRLAGLFILGACGTWMMLERIPVLLAASA